MQKKTNRSQFIAWLKLELARQGAQLPKSITYHELQKLIVLHGIKKSEHIDAR